MNITVYDMVKSNGLIPLQPFSIAENYYPMIDPNLLFGVELEIENLDDEEEDRRERTVPGMESHEDGSLRNNGWEYITHPMNLSNLFYVLRDFFYTNKFTEENYSDRCSVHVHANCRDLELSQLRLVYTLYLIFEKCFFYYVHPERKDNIFCVPLYETVNANKTATSENTLLLSAQSWRKYTALNLAPLWTLGTIEFRHMLGTPDYKRIILWCEIISCLFRYARNNSYKSVIDTLNNLNTSSAYELFARSVFVEEYIASAVLGPNFRLFMEEGVIEMKLASLTREIRSKSTETLTYTLNTAAFFPTPAIHPGDIMVPSYENNF